MSPAVGRPRVWIDLANSPHPLIFEPVVECLAARGSDVTITARAHGQTAELARERWPDAFVLGDASPSGLPAKAGAIAGRIRRLRRWARAQRPHVALSHNSYAQLVAARSLGIPAVTAMDYEHQPVNHLAFRLAKRVIVPRAFPERSLRRQGATGGKAVRYDGFKEELYLRGREHDSGLRERLGLPDRGSGIVAVARTAPAGAMYHRGENDMLARAVDTILAAGAWCVVLARHPDQRAQFEGRERIVVPDQALDALSLVAESDLFVGAGGTMSREAALMGVASYSLFAGRPAAVDRELARTGALRLIRDVDEIGVQPRERDHEIGLRGDAGSNLAELFCDVTFAAVR